MPRFIGFKASSNSFRNRCLDDVVCKFGAAAIRKGVAAIVSIDTAKKY